MLNASKRIEIGSQHKEHRNQQKLQVFVLIICFTVAFIFNYAIADKAILKGMQRRALSSP